MKDEREFLYLVFQDLEKRDGSIEITKTDFSLFMPIQVKSKGIVGGKDVSTL